MKIAIVSDRIYPFFKGGAEKRYWDIARYLVEKGHKVSFYTAQWPGMKKVMKIEGIKIFSVYKVKNFYVNGRKSIKESLKFSINLLFPLLKGDFDIIDCENFPYFSIFTCKIISMLKKKPLIVSWHEVWGKYWYEYLGWKGFFGKSIESFAVKLPDKIIAVSNKVGNDLLKIGARKDNIKVNYNWVDLEKLKKINVTPIFLFTEWPYDKEIREKIRSLFDCIIELKAVERTIFLRNYFTLSKVSWISNLKRQEIPFKIASPGGVKVYIPKILVTGPYNAGKSSFVHSASGKAVSVERIGLDSKGTTVALDHGNVDFEGFSVDLFGTPGQERFDPLLEMLGGESVGVIIIIDSTAPETFERAEEMLEKTKTEGLPSIVVANKANMHGALKTEQIRKKMKLPKEIPIIPVIAASIKAIREGKNKKKICMLKKDDVNKVLDTLFKEII